jgi:chromate transporter
MQRYLHLSTYLPHAGHLSWLRHGEQPEAAAADPAMAGERARPSMAQLTRVLLWIGATSFGGSTPPYFYEELVRRRGWLKAEDFTEGYAVGRLLPGPTGANTLAYLIQTIRGPLAAIYCLLPYTLPSVLIMVGLMLLLGGPLRSPVFHGALVGAAMGGIGVLVATVIQMTASVRRARFWQVFTIAAFAANGLLGLNFAFTLLVLGLLSVACNRPKEA